MTPVLNLTFHGVGAPPSTAGAGERDVWLERDEFESVLQLVSGRPEVTLSFDDGNASDIDVALEALRRHRLTATFFVVADRIGEPGYLDEDGIRELVRAGMRLGHHGLTHRPWRGLGARELDEELAGKAVLEELLGHPVSVAACPFGSYNRRVLRSLRAAGFERVLTSDGGWADSTRWLQPRHTVRTGAPADAVDRLLAKRRAQPVGRRVTLMVKRWR